MGVALSQRSPTGIERRRRHREHLYGRAVHAIPGAGYQVPGASAGASAVLFLISATFSGDFNLRKLPFGRPA